MVVIYHKLLSHVYIFNKHLLILTHKSVKFNCFVSYTITPVDYVFICITDFTKLKAHYHTILRLMPDDYELTVGKLVNCISDDQICTILSSSNSIVANKIILDCLIERMRCREELLDLCDQLEKITTSHDMKIVINEIRLG